MQQRRRNEIATKRQREREERQKYELEQIQRAELQRKIIEEQAKQAAALAAIEIRQQQGLASVEGPPPMYPNEEEKTSLDLADYYEGLEEDVISTAIPQVIIKIHIFYIGVFQKFC